MGHAHAPLSASGRHQGRLTIAFGLVVTFLVVEFVAAVVSGSLALLSDAGHMLTDAVGIGLALGATRLANRPAAGHRTYGYYRLEVLAALANAVLLGGVAVYVLIEAARRLAVPTEVDGGPLLVVATLGLIVNLVMFALLRPGAQESLNLEGAYMEVVADAAASVAAMTAGVVLLTTGWTYVDPIMGALVALAVAPRAWRLGRKTLRVLVEAAPAHIDLDALESELNGVQGVVDVHDLHVWTLTSAMETATAHLTVADGTDTHAVLDEARVVLQESYGVAHATLQIEPTNHTGCDEVGW